MCGIVGYVSVKTEYDLSSAMAAIAHRGPDGRVIERGLVPGSAAGPAARFSFGHARLSIIDLEGGTQPMRRGPLLMVFNGEIYNYVELREELESRHGAKFITRSDSEVLLAAFEVWGKDCVQRFNGMWAFAILNTETGELICSRDRMGKKPFYFVEREGEFFFASEAHALLEFTSRRTPELSTICSFIASSDVDPTKSFFDQIEQLPSASILFIRPGSRKSVRESYWTPRVDQDSDITYDEAQAKIVELMEDAVRLRLRSDVPLGVAASGGLDSTIILMDALRKIPTVNTVSVTFDGDFPRNETSFIERLVSEVSPKAIYAKSKFEVSMDEMMNLAKLSVEYLGEPCPYTSVPFVIVLYAAANASGIKVMLEGQGADELFGGYDFYLPFQKNAVPFRQYSLSNFLISLKFRSRFVQGLYYRLNSLKPYLAKASQRELKYFDSASSLNEALTSSQSSWILPGLLLYGDRLSMRYGVEVRLPFLDYRIAEFANSLPPAFKISNGVTKRVLRDAFKDAIPKFVIERPKIGFGNPLDEQINKNLSMLIDKYVVKGAVANSPIFSPSLISAAKSGSLRRLPNVERLIWRFMQMDMWAERFNLELSPAG